jgi:hypothetical protein
VRLVMGAVLCHVRPSSLTLKPRAIFTRFFPERACSQSNAGSSGACPRRILTAFIFVLAPSLLDTHCLVENLVRHPTVATTGSLAWSVLWAFSLFSIGPIDTYLHLLFLIPPHAMPAPPLLTGCTMLASSPPPRPLESHASLSCMLNRACMHAHAPATSPPVPDDRVAACRSSPLSALPLLFSAPPLKPRPRRHVLVLLFQPGAPPPIRVSRVYLAERC